MPEKVLDPQVELYNELSKDHLVFSTFFCPNHHPLPTPRFHVEIADALSGARYTAIGAPRESAKSTHVCFDFTLHKIIFKKKRFIIILSNTFKKAAGFLEALKKELTENEFLKTSFPGVKISKDAEGDSVFTHTDGFETKVLCKGVENIGAIRGVKFKYSRPDLIICDDIEDDELVKNPERRSELQRNYDEALVPAGERGVCQYVFIGTILHDDSLLARLLSKDKYLEYKKLLFRALSAKNESLWPEKMPVEYLLELQKNKPTVFAKEYQNDPVSGSNVRFDKKDFRYWRLEGERYLLFDEFNSVIQTGMLYDCRAAISCDLAWKEKRNSDASVLMPGYLTPTNEILVESYVHKVGMRPEECIEQLFLMVERLEKITGAVVPVGFEKAMLETVTQYLLRRDMQKRNKFILTKELAWDHDKETRIEIRLQPRYAQHVIFHKQGMGDLEHQLTRFPSAAHDDLIDAEQGLVQLLQNPRKAKEAPHPNDEFMMLRKFMIDAKKGIQNSARYPGKTSGVQAIRSYK